ncbi:MAG: GDSL-type esterase/lipase family protein [Acholeplasmataceae bacterium]
MIYIIIGLVIIIPISGFFCFKIGKNNAMSTIMDMFMKFGYTSKVDAFKVLNTHIRKHGIVFVGDSITQDYNVYEYFNGSNVYNRGIGGDTSIGVYNRLKESVYDLNPKKVFLQIGTNDLQMTEDNVEKIHDRFKKIIDNIKTFDNEIEIYILSVYPVNALIDPITVGKRRNEQILILNDLNKKISNTIYIDIYSSLIKDGVLNQAYTLEGLHLNQKGYEIVTNILEKYVKE